MAATAMTWSAAATAAMPCSDTPDGTVCSVAPGTTFWAGAAAVGLVVTGVVYVGGGIAAAGLSLLDTAGQLTALSELARYRRFAPYDPYPSWPS